MSTEKQITYAVDLVMCNSRSADELRNMMASGLIAPGFKRNGEIDECARAVMGDVNISMGSYILGRLIDAKDD